MSGTPGARLGPGSGRAGPTIMGEWNALPFTYLFGPIEITRATSSQAG